MYLPWVFFSLECLLKTGLTVYHRVSTIPPIFADFQDCLSCLASTETTCVLLLLLRLLSWQKPNMANSLGTVCHILLHPRLLMISCFFLDHYLGESLIWQQSPQEVKIGGPVYTLCLFSMLTILFVRTEKIYSKTGFSISTNYQYSSRLLVHHTSQIPWRHLEDFWRPHWESWKIVSRSWD